MAFDYKEYFYQDIALATNPIGDVVSPQQDHTDNAGTFVIIRIHRYYTYGM